MIFFLLRVATCWTVPLPSASVPSLGFVQYAHSARQPQSGHPNSLAFVYAGRRSPGPVRPAVSGPAQLTTATAAGAVVGFCGVGALLGYGSRAAQSRPRTRAARRAAFQRTAGPWMDAAAAGEEPCQDEDGIRADAEAAFRLLDLDGNGEISVGEMKSYLRQFKYTGPAVDKIYEA